MDDAGNTVETVAVVEAVAEAAQQIVAENNEAAIEAAAVNEAIIEAFADEHQRRRVDEIEQRAMERDAASLERIAQCETNLTIALVRLGEVELALVAVMARLELLTPPALPNQSEVVEGQPEVVVVTPPENPESPEPESPPPAAQKKRRHLI